MARIVTAGAETGHVGTTASNWPDGRAISGATVDATTSRSGSSSYKCAGTAAAAPCMEFALTQFTTVSLGTGLYPRWYAKLDALPNAAKRIATWGSGSAAVSVKLTSTGTLQLWNDVSNTQIGSDSASALVADSTTWYRIEFYLLLASGSIDETQLRLDDVTVASISGAAIADSVQANLDVGWFEAPGVNANMWIDDVAINDSTGTEQKTWAGSGKVVLLKPISDNAGGTGWTLGTGTALGGNGFTSVDNVPPVGVADLAAGSDPKQIRNAASAANSNYDANLATYTTAGIKQADTLNALVPIVATAAPVTTSAKQGTVGVVSNPAIANVALGAGGTSGAFWSGLAGGTYPTGWKWSFGTTTYHPAFTVGTSPVMRITQVTSSTRIAVVCSMGLYVDYTPDAGQGGAGDQENLQHFRQGAIKHSAFY